MNSSFRRALAHYQRSVFNLASTGTVTVNGDLVHLVPSMGVSLETTASQLVSSYTDQTSSSVGSPTSTSWVNAPRFRPYGLNNNNALYYPGAGFVGLNFDAAARAIKNNKPGISAVMQLILDGSATINAPILFISQGTNNGTNGFTIGATANNALYGAFRRTDTSATVTLTTPNNFYTPGESFTLAVTADFAVGNGTDPVVTFYKNGVASYSAPLTGNGIGNTSSTNALVFNLGGTAGATIGPNMFVGESYFYPRSLTAGEVVIQSSLLKSNAGIKNLQVLTPTNFQAFNRDLVTNSQNITITGTYDTTATVQPTAIEASWAPNGTGFTTIASSGIGTLTGGTFSGTLPNMPAGQGVLTVRFVNDTTQVVQKRYVSVTDIILEVGQSNNTTVLDPTYSDANGPQSPKTYTLGSSGMKIPVFNSHFAYGKWGDADKLGSYHVAFAADFYNSHGYPPAIVFAAIGGTNSTKWRSDATDLYGGANIAQSFYDTFGLGLTLVARAISMGNTASTNTGVNAIHDEQGEADAGSTTQATFLANKTNTYATLRTAFPKAVIMCALLQQQVGSTGSAVDVSAVNAAYVQAYTTLPGVAPGADLSALMSDAGGSGVSGSVTKVHLMSDANVAAQALAWATSSKASMGYGPILDYITGNSNRVGYSLRKLRSAYSGYAINVRRLSDSQTLDIGFDAYGNLDLVSLANFAGTSSVVVTTIYDQLPMAAHFVAPAAGNQAYIVNGGVLNLYNNRPYIQFDQATNYYDMATSGMGLLNGVSAAYGAAVISETQNSATSPAYRIIVTAQVNSTTSSRWSMSTNNNGGTNNQLSAAQRKTDAGTIAFEFSGTGAGAQYVGLAPFVFHCKQDWSAASNSLYLNNASPFVTATGQTAGTTDATNCSSIRLGASAGASPTQLSHMRFNELILQGATMADIDRIKLAHSQGYAWGAVVA